MYKFYSNDSLIENMYHMITIFKYYRIIPVFVFDGKPPDEKKEVLEQRYLDKKVAEKRYKELLLSMETAGEDKSEMMVELDKLKKQFIRIKKDDITAVKKLLESCGVTYYNAPGEADQLCAKMVLNREAWACLSDDMDMFAYGCTRVLRYISLMNHTVVFYNIIGILRELEMSMTHFREILVLSGTDYNKNDNESMKLIDLMKQYQVFICRGTDISFYKWLSNRTFSDVIDENTFDHVYSMFTITDYKNSVLPVKSKGSIDTMKDILKHHGFVFVQ
jgi:5'-3' exonuclease